MTTDTTRDYHVEALVVGTVDLGVHRGPTADAAEVAAMASPSTRALIERLLCPACAARLQAVESEHVMSEPVGADAARETPNHAVTA